MDNPQEKPPETSKPFRTYQGDVEKILKEGEGSFAKIAIAENDKRIRQGFSTAEPEPVAHSKLIIWISISLIVVGIGALSALYFFGSPDDEPILNTEPRPLIIADIEKKLD